MNFSSSNRKVSLLYNVFAYGTLMFPEVAVPIAQIHSEGEPLTIQGFRRYEATTRERGNYPAIVKDESCSVDGLLFMNLSEQQLVRLDRFEGVNDDDTGLYVRENISVLYQGQSVDVWLYVCGPELEHKLSQPLVEAWNPELFRRNELQWYVNEEV